MRPALFTEKNSGSSIAISPTLCMLVEMAKSKEAMLITHKNSERGFILKETYETALLELTRAFLDVPFSEKDKW